MEFRLVQNHSENDKYNLTMVCFNNIPKKSVHKAVKYIKKAMHKAVENIGGFSAAKIHFSIPDMQKLTSTAQHTGVSRHIATQ